MVTLSKISYTEEIKKELLKAGKEEKDFHISFEEMCRELYSFKGEVEFRKRIQLHALMKDISLGQLKDMLKGHGVGEDASNKWFLGINPFPDDIKHLLLEYFKLKDELTLEERVLYFRAHENYDKLLSKGRGRLSDEEKEKRRVVVERYKAIFEVEKNESYEEQENNYYLEEIKEKFVSVPKKEKYMLANYFHAYVAIPFEAFNFAIKYAKLNAVGRWMLRRAMKKIICDKGNSILRTEEIHIMEKMLKVDKRSLQDAIENSDDSELEKLFYENVNHINFHEKLFFTNMEIYSLIETNEWKMIIDFVKLGEFNNPEIQNFSDSQKKVDYFVEMLRNDFSLGY
ncbi:hypothetical protein [Lacrimispora sp.]|uniref:hypothetical protein n=1 Tax=Lacrimispora sp. TaxID=2719234 RepID=UPI0028AE8C89|nr:hypothetical protein [Lacrimispora sp.]